MNDAHSKATFENAVGAIDGILHETQRPRIEPEHEFYSGHGRDHCFNIQVNVISILVILIVIINIIIIINILLLSKLSY